MAKQFDKETPNDTEHFSFLVRKNNIESFGFNNRSKSHPLAIKFKYRYPTIHSELAAILNHSDSFDKYYMVNIRIGRSGKLLMSKPCRACQRLLRYYNINEVLYSTDCGFKTWLG